MSEQKAPTRCVNLDWLECHCIEPTEPRDIVYFMSLGYICQDRGYGTRIYHEMFTIMDKQGHPMIEVRRRPKSTLHTDRECHLRLVNAYCYMDNAADIMANFIETHGYYFNRISRVDICLDFAMFDSGDEPNRFLQRYIRRKYSKMNQANIHAHGTDTWTGREWNSVAWGAPSSDVGTKMYNKTMELYDPTTKKYGKPYIRYAWLKAGLIDDWQNVTKDGTLQHIWRVEFSIRSSVKKWFKIELNGNTKQYQSIRNGLDMYNSREKLLTMFASLTNHYFHFKKYKDGVRKDRCPDKPLFFFQGEQYTYKIDKDVMPHNGHQDRPLLTLLTKIRDYREKHVDREIRQACSILIKAMEQETLAMETSLFTKEEIQAFRIAVSLKSRYHDRDVAVLMNEVKKLLHINDNTAIF